MALITLATRLLLNLITSAAIYWGYSGEWKPCRKNWSGRHFLDAERRQGLCLRKLLLNYYTNWASQFFIDLPQWVFK